jgi:ubiquinone/menaquinone biosynthesis C-methylase UbiE
VTSTDERVREAGVSNVELLTGTIEDVPLPSAAVDVVVFTHEAAPGMHGAIVRATKPAA